jgi:glutamate/tyrosine decarboxylase-like PLP-dependent enzyme
VADPLEQHDQVVEALRFACEEACRYLDGIDGEPVLPDGQAEAIAAWRDPMPETGLGTLPTLSELASRGCDAATRSSGPRFFHFVMGGGTPAALAADWLTSAYDQVAFAWVSSPFATALEQVATDWLRQLFELPEEFGGVLTSGATMANFVALSAARNAWAERLGVDVEAHGLSGLPAPAILTSGYIHPSAVQAIGMLGWGRDSIHRFARDEVGRIDLPALSAALESLGDTPAIIVANAGEVNAGDFDPLADLADLAERHGAWLHVDGAFGLFARLAPATRRMTDGVERADSVISDGHKWLNVPYDCGFAFVKESERVARALNVGAPYLPKATAHPSFGFLSPENSRRARALSVWATLRAYGRDGYRAMVERHLALAQRLAAAVDAAPELQRLAEVPLNIVCFRARPDSVPEDRLDDLNRELGAALLTDGRVIAGATTYGGRAALRPAIVNWRTREPDVDAIVDVVRELVAARA